MKTYLTLDRNSHKNDSPFTKGAQGDFGTFNALQQITHFVHRSLFQRPKLFSTTEALAKVVAKNGITQ